MQDFSNLDVIYAGSSPTARTMEIGEINCRVHGKVQLVMFRDFVCRHTRRLSLKGYVRNMPDFTLEVVAQGKRDNLEKLIACLNKGPFLARVTRVDVEWQEPIGTRDSFEIVF